MPATQIQREAVAASGTGRFVESASGKTFGDVGGYAPCGCCGTFHSVFESGGGSGLFGTNADDRGGLNPNGRTSLSPLDAGAQLTRSNVAWGTLGQAANVTYSFRSTAPATMPSDTEGFSRFTEVQIAATLLALASWSDVANITFTRVQDADGYSNNAVMVFGNYSSGSEGAAAFAYLPNNRTIGSNSGDVWINTTPTYNVNPVMLGYGQQVLTHEIGHAIGLSHPSSYNAGEGVSISYAVNASYAEDSRQYSVMSYFNESNTGGSFGSGRYAAAPLLDDIAAAQRLYGANMTTRTGDTTYGFNSNAGQVWFSATSATSALIFAAWDAGGTDTFDFSGYGNAQLIDLRQGAFSDVGGLRGNVSIAMGAVIENAIGGSGADTINGNSGNNLLTGGAGNDRIDGGLGTDTAVFSGNRSAYTISWNGAIGTVTGADGTDTLVNVEFLRFADQTVAAAPTGGLTVTGDALNNVLTGTAFADTLTGGGGNDQITGAAGDDFLGGGTGNDTVDGGDGNDYIYGDLGDDVIVGGSGVDMIDYSGSRATPGSVALAAGVNVDLTAGRATGGAGTDTLSGIENIIGTRFNETLRGDAGNNSISGFGGSDAIYGGAGNDQLFGGDGAEVGGAPDIVKARTTINNSTGTAVNIDGGFDRLSRTDVANSTTVPHATIVATTHGGIEYYAVTVAAGAQIVLDIDNGSFDTTLRLLGPNGAQVAANDDLAPDGGPATDSQITFTATTAGVYYIAVGQYDAGGASDFTSKAPAAGGTYTLHVSVAGHAFVPTTFIGNQMYGEAGDDVLTGGAAADLLVGGAGSDIIAGGGGVDTAAYSGVARSYSTVTQTRVAGGAEGGADTLSGVEVLRFLDGRVSYDVTDVSTVVYRLYDAAFDRAPDVFGLADYSRAIASGQLTVQQILDVFAGSAEFQARYGALNNEQFVREMYRFSLNREGDAQGVAQYVNALNAGTVTRAQVLGIFSESQEHQALINAVITSQGLFVQDEGTAAIARLYDSVFNRLPDLAGLQAYRASLDQGFTLTDIGAVLVASPEFQQRFGALSNQQFVEQIYRFVLDREGDPAGVAAYVQALNQGYTRADVVLVLSESLEHRVSYQSTFDSQVRNLGVGTSVAPEAEGPKGLEDALVLPDGPMDEGKTHLLDDAFVLPGLQDGADGIDAVAPLDLEETLAPVFESPSGSPHLFEDQGHQPALDGFWWDHAGRPDHALLH